MKTEHWLTNTGVPLDEQISDTVHIRLECPTRDCLSVHALISPAHQGPSLINALRIAHLHQVRTTGGAWAAG